MTKDSRIGIRLAGPDDAGTIMKLIKALAEYEELAHEVAATEEDIRRTGFGERPYFECLLAEVDGEAVGFALFFHNYSTFAGRPGLYVEDLFVEEAHRSLGIGKLLMRELARVAVERGCARFELWVLHWNPARDFYHRIGFRHMEDWLPYRMDGEALKAFAEG